MCLSGQECREQAQMALAMQGELNLGYNSYNSAGVQKLQRNIVIFLVLEIVKGCFEVLQTSTETSEAVGMTEQNFPSWFLPLYVSPNPNKLCK